MRLRVTTTTVALALLLAAAAAALALADHDQHAAASSLPDDDYVIAKYRPASSVVVHLSFNLTHRDERGGYAPGYASFLSDMDYHINRTGARWIHHHPVLGRQRLRAPPATLFNVTLSGDQGDTVSFYLRSDNLYMLGFSNKRGTVFSFKGDPYQLPGSKALSFGSGYPDFFPRVGHHGLLKLLVNRSEALEHLRTLSQYRATATDAGLKFPLAFFVLVICEAERFPPLRDQVMKRWDGAAKNIDDTVAKKKLLLDLVVNWGTFSCALLTWNRDGETARAWRHNPRAAEIARFGVTTAQAALATVNPILQTRPCN